jgi:hypothetical protein
MSKADANAFASQLLMEYNKNGFGGLIRFAEVIKSHLRLKVFWKGACPSLAA